MAENTVAITDANFDASVIKSSLPVLVDFWAPWCGPCVAIGPVLESLAQEYKGKLTGDTIKGTIDSNFGGTRRKSDWLAERAD